MLDYKYDIQVLAEELADQDGLDYLSLSSENQIRYYQQAEKQYQENRRY